MNNIFLLFLFILVFIFSSTCSHLGQRNSSFYYVSKTMGSDKNPGTKDEPFQTIQKAVEKLEAGDTCYIMEGIYREEVIFENIHGNSENPIVLMAFTGDQVILDGTIDITNEWELHEKNI